MSATSDPAALGNARRKVRDAMMRAGLRADDVAAMEVAAGEVLSNVHRNAYNGDVGLVSVAVLCHSYAVSLLISDGGDATEAPEIPRGLPPRTRKGGSGLYLVGRLAEDVRIRVGRSGHGLVVRFSKHLSAHGTPANRRQTG
jgi:anti-sigma regulatory factor (Ser/Thr protein kinase)